MTHHSTRRMKNEMTAQHQRQHLSSCSEIIRRQASTMLSLLAFYHCLSSSERPITSVSALHVQTRANSARQLLPSSHPFSESNRITRWNNHRHYAQHRQHLFASSSTSLNLKSRDQSFLPENDVNMPMESSQEGTMNRREVFSNSAKALFAGLTTPMLFDPTDPANAILLQFPVDQPTTQPLKNKYHFMRAGISELEDEGIYSTNPLFLTNRENALSDKGYNSLKKTIATLKKTPCQPTVIYHSLAANGMDTGDLIARELKQPRERLLPEFTYLDQRGVGLWDSNEESVIRPAVWAMDYEEAGAEGFGGKPPANTDGTPNECLHDQFYRLRQFLSLQETRTSGEIILVIFPDGTGPALLSCMIAGIPYSDVHALEFKPGEIRLDISVESIKELYEKRKDDPEYLATLEEGKEQLKQLRSMKPNDFNVSFKDAASNEQEVKEAEALAARREAAALEKKKKDEERKAAMQEQMRISKEKKAQEAEQKRLEKLAAKEKKGEITKQQLEARQAKYTESKQSQVSKKSDAIAAAKQKNAEAQAAAKQKQLEAQELAKKKRAEAQELANKKRQEKFEELAAARAAKSSGAPATSTSDSSSEVSLFGLSPPILAAGAAAALGAVLLSGENDEEEQDSSGVAVTNQDGSGGGDSATAAAAVASAPKTNSTAATAQEPTKVRDTVPIAKKETVEPVVASSKTSVTTKASSVQTDAHKKIPSKPPVQTPIKVQATTASSVKKTPTKVQVTNVPKGGTKKKQKPKLKPLNSSIKKDTVAKAPVPPPPAKPTPIQPPAPTNDWRKARTKPRLKRLNSADSTFKDDPKEDTSKSKPPSVKTPAAKPKTKDPLVEAAKRQKIQKEKKQQRLQQQQQAQHHRPAGITPWSQKPPALKKSPPVVAAKPSPTHAAPPPTKKKSSLFDNTPPVITTTKTTSYNVYEDDVDDSAWLQVLSDIRDEEEDDDEDDDFGMIDYASIANGAEL